MTPETKSTRREFLQTAALGAGLLVSGGQVGVAQPWGSGRGQMQTQRGPLPILPSNPSIQHHRNRCRNCGRCRAFCQNTTGVFGHPVPTGEDACIRCGQCTHFCPRAITEQYHYQEVARAIADPNKIVVATTAPAIRVSLGEMYRLAPGTNVEGKIVGALKQLGVDHVLDATFAADLTIMEEAAELLQRVDKLDRLAEPIKELFAGRGYIIEGGARGYQTLEYEKYYKSAFPMFTSCCPGWVRFAKLFYPDFLPRLSTTKSPLLMQGALVKTYFAQKLGIDPAKIVHVALMPCTAKKAEILLPGMNAAGIAHGKPEMRDVDFALTTRELAYLLNEGRVNFPQAAEAPYSSLMGAGSGAGMIFGNTGGVMEAALRSAYKLLNGENPPANFLELRPVRGLENVRRATVDLGKRKLNVAIVHGIGRVRPLLEAIRNGTETFHFVEVMACPGGCIGGGGQPITTNTNVRQQRINALYQRDAGQAIRLSTDNPEIKTIYSEFLGVPLGERAKRLLHVDPQRAAGR